MVLAGFLALGLLAQSTPTIDPGSVYGLKTYVKNAEFGFMPDNIGLAFPPSEIEKITMHVLKGSSEVVGGNFYPTETPYPSFRQLRFQPMPVINLATAGDYVMEFRDGGTPISRFPFSIKKTTSGDEFNQTTFWDFVTPVDKMGFLATSNSEDDYVWLHAWLAPRREGVATRASMSVKVSHGGKVIAHALPEVIHDVENMKRSYRLMKTEGQGRAAWKKSDLLKLSGAVTATISVPGKTLRTFSWSVAGGKVKLHPRSEYSYSPRTDYWMPRRLSGVENKSSFWHLEEVYWAAGK